MPKCGVRIAIVCTAIGCLQISGAQKKAFERLDTLPAGEQSGLMRSLTSVKDTSTVTVSLNASYAATWSAVKRVAQKFDKLGNRPIVGINEQSGRIQNGKIQLESIALSGSLLAWRDEFVTEVTASDPQHTNLSVSRKLVAKELGSGRWTPHVSNGKLERWFITQVIDEINKPTADPATTARSVKSSVFVSNDNASNVLELMEDKTFYVIQNGRQASGTYEWSGDVLTLITGNTRLDGRLSGNTLTDNEHKLWRRRLPSATTVPQSSQAASGNSTAPTNLNAETIGNAEILKLVQARLSDEIIVGKIKISSCHFDLSTDALIKLKEANVSDAVIQELTNAPQR